MLDTVFSKEFSICLEMFRKSAHVKCFRLVTFLKSARPYMMPWEFEAIPESPILENTCIYCL